MAELIPKLGHRADRACEVHFEWILTDLILTLSESVARKSDVGCLESSRIWEISRDEEQNCGHLVAADSIVKTFEN